MTARTKPKDATIMAASLPTPLAAWAWQVDAWQRGVLFLDVMRERAEQARAHAADIAPNVLRFRRELVLDGRTLPRPVNYLLARIVPEADPPADPGRRPFVVVDPRAGHGPGIGGFKADSEIGVAMKAGHPCYFVGFLPDPVPGQTIEDIARAEATFLETVIALHPEADGKPCVVGNCQAGWAVMLVAAQRPELFGPIILAGSPLSYWAGVRGANPMRYSGGLLGGSWLTALTGDLGAGVFDGAWLVQNFENQNPANTLWSKQYNLYAKIDTEAPRYLEFEKWWGGHVMLNAEEMQFIVDELFVGNRLAAGEIRTADGTAIDLRTIRSPIVVFCSKGDNITPPQQALDWVLDLYDSVDEIRSWGQTIVYTIHESVGHLGIFVSGGVAKKEHDEFASNIDLIDLLPPGLYEMVLAPKDGATVHPEMAHGDWVMTLEPRTLDDIRALGANDLADERRFATAARVSEINLSLYRAFAQPVVKAMVNPAMAEAARKLHPLRLSYEMFGPGNPWMAWVKPLAEKVREDRKAAEPENPFQRAQEEASRRIVEGLDAWRRAAEKLSEETFLAVYGNPALQAAVGVDPNGSRPPRKAGKSLLHKALRDRRIEELQAAIPTGDLRTALVRGLLHVAMARGAPDERAFEAIRRIRKRHEGAGGLPLPAFKQLFREQFFMLVLERDAALAAIPAMLPEDVEPRRAAFAMLCEVLEARGPVEGEAGERLQEVRSLFGLANDDWTPAEAEAPKRARAARD